MRFVVTVSCVFVLLVFAVTGEEIKPQALPEVDALKYQVAYRDFIIEQQKYDAMYQRFLALTEVKTVLDKVNEMQKSLAEVEKKVLDERKLSRSDFFLDFQAGEIKPVPKKAVGATSAPQSPPPEEKK